MRWPRFPVGPGIGDPARPTRAVRPGAFLALPGLLAVLVLGVLGACTDADSGPDSIALEDPDAGGVLVFGEDDDACASISLRNEVDDERIRTEGVACVRDLYERGRPFTWDTEVYTVEGDPIYDRYVFDGESVTIIGDDRRDAFGRSGVGRMRCATLTFGPHLPEGVGCDGIESLPGGRGFVDR